MPLEVFGPDREIVVLRRRKYDVRPTEVKEVLKAVVCQTCRPNLE